VEEEAKGGKHHADKLETIEKNEMGGDRNQENRKKDNNLREDNQHAGAKETGSHRGPL
jgi:hypothetical protein